MEGLNHLRVDEVYDLDNDGSIEDPATSGDDWRIERVTVNGPGQLGQIVKQIVYAYASATTGTVDSTAEYFLGYDVLGNVSVISNAAGSEVDQFEQDAFGNDPENTWTNPAGGITEHLTTKQYDDFLGLYYFNARWHDPQAGAFVSLDDFRQCGLDTDDYLFCENSPTIFTDPDGNTPRVVNSCYDLCDRWAVGRGVYAEFNHRTVCECSDAQMDELKAEVKRVCAEVASHKPLSKTLRACLTASCNSNVEVRCRTKGDYCGDDVNPTSGYTFGGDKCAKTLTSAPQEVKPIFVCMNRFSDGSLNPQYCPGAAVIHEMGHHCGCRHTGDCWSFYGSTPKKDDYGVGGRCDELPWSKRGRLATAGWCN